jgi:hypothetical protein
MTKTSFSLKLDAGRKYVYKSRDELTKNHRQNDDELVSGFMPQTGTVRCPVASYEKYMSKLHPGLDRLWCYPKESFHADEPCWYTSKPVGVNTLMKFLPRLSEKCNLSRIYKNHSLRATGATVLHQSNHSPTEIMAVTGHKSVSSLQVYQHTSSKQKLVMGHTLAESISASGPSTSTSSSMQLQKSTTQAQQRHPLAAGRVDEAEQACVLEQLSQEDLDAFFSAENEPADPGAAVPLFRNCNFSGPITINIVRK